MNKAGSFSGGLLAKTGLLLWSLWIILDYAIHHPYLTKSLTSLPYLGILTGLAMVGGAAAYWVWQGIKKQENRTFKWSYRGVFLYLIVQLLAVVILVAFSGQTSLPELAMGTRIGYFLSFGTLVFLGLLLLFTAAYAAGEAGWTTLFSTDIEGQKTKGDFLVKTALGFSLLGFVFVVIGQFGGLQPFIIWPVLLAVMGWQWRAVLQFIKRIAWEKHTVTLQHAWVPVVGLLLLTPIAFNWIAAFKTFPIGYDGSALYVNTAQLIAESGALPAGGQAFNWSVMMGVGQILYGDGMFAILLSHLMNLACVFMIYRVARLWLSSDFALLSTALFLLAPYVAFHGIVDEKVDLAVVFFVLASFLPLAQFTQATTDRNTQIPWRLLVVAGFIAGYAFGIKYTVVMYIIALGTWYSYIRGGKWAYFAAFLLGLSLIFISGIYRFGYLDISSGEALVLGGVFGVLGIAALWRAFRGKFDGLVPLVRQLSIFAGAILLAFAPWMIKHLSENQSLSIGGLVEGQSVQPSLNLVPLSSIYRPDMDSGNFLGQHRWSDIPQRSLSLNEARPPFVHFTKVQQDSDLDFSSGAVREEIQRYMGYEAELWRYVSLPYDLTLNTNIPNNRFLDIGFLYFLLLSILLLFTAKGDRPWWSSILIVLGGILLIGFSYAAQFTPADGSFDAALATQRSQALLNVYPGGEGFWLSRLYAFFLPLIVALASGLSTVYQLGTQLSTMGAILVLALSFGGMFWLFRNRIATLSVSFTAFGAMLAAYAFIWWVMGNGIVWYAMPLFAIFPVFLLYWFEHPEKLMGSGSTSFARGLLGGVIGLTLLFNISLYFTSAYPTDNAGSALFRWPFVDYISNPTARKSDIINAFNPILSDATRMMNSDLSAKIYQVNTHYGFLIERNNTRVFDDPTLDKFDQIASVYDDESYFFDQLKAQGYRYIFFDLRTGTLDKTPEQSLQQKFVRIARLLTESPKVRLLTTDNMVQNPSAPLVDLPNGQQANATRGLRGQTVYFGRLALFEIL